jgi:hypothetical protein
MILLPEKKEVDDKYNDVMRESNDPKAYAFGKGGKRKHLEKNYYYVFWVSREQSNYIAAGCNILKKYGYDPLVVGSFIFARRKTPRCVSS